MRVISAIALIAITALTGLAQTSGAKRGLSWDEAALPLQQHHMELMTPGINWVYNWGNTPRNPELYGSASLSYAPMCWNSNFNEAAIRDYLNAHPETRYLLGFNEPNFSSQSNMTPAYAASQWPRLEAIAADYEGLKLVAPALNFTGERVGGRMWSPYEWLDEFVRLYPEARIDCLALHCYMNWYSANTWFATEYIYSDLYDPTKRDVYGRYPNLVNYLDAYKAEHGHFPPMMLTEFCAWENDGTINGVDFQIDQMTQKVQKLEQSDLVEGYAWFIGNVAAGTYPYMGFIEAANANSGLSDLGKVYVHMSSFDTDRHYAPGENISAKDYVDATTDERLVRVRPNSDAASDSPLQIELTPGAYVQYSIEVAEKGDYMFTLHMSTASDIAMMLYVDNRRTSTSTLPSTSGQWADRAFPAQLESGIHDITFFNASDTPLLLNDWHFEVKNSGLTEIAGTEEENAAEYYTLQGLPAAEPANGLYIKRTAGADKGTLIILTNN